MAILDGRIIVDKYQILIWMDAKRYRATIAAKTGSSYGYHVKTMVHKDRITLINRATAWANMQAPSKG